MGALFLADHYFNQVLSAQVKPSVFEAFLSGATKAFLQAWVSKKHYYFKLALLGHPTADFKTIEGAWNTVVGPAKCYDIDSGADDDGGTVIQAALLLFYDLLREYCQQCVSLTISIGGVDQEISSGKAISMVASGNGGIIEFDGLNAAHRKEMYDLFDQIDSLYGRPKITNYKDLVTNWFKGQ
jgi:hypothetical protein